MKNLVSVIIVNYNGKKWLELCLNSLRRQNYKPVEVIVVDNASRDGSVQYIKKYFPQIKLIILDKNCGYAEGNNIGYGSSRGDYVLFLNNDTEVKPDFLKNLVTKLNKDITIGGAQSKLLILNDKSRLDCCGSFLTSTGFLYHYGYGQKDGPKYNRELEIFSAKGACMMFKRDVLEKVKVDGEIFDRRYFAYFEETDLCNRVWLAGYKIKYLPKSVIYHERGATSSRLNSQFIQYNSFKNRINTYLKNFQLKEFVYILPIHIIIIYFVALISLLRLDLNMFFAINKAILWNIFHLRESFKKRRYIQNNIRKIKDENYLKMTKFNPSFDYFFNIMGNLNNYNFEKDNIDAKHI